MSFIAKLKKIEPVVRKILTESEASRDDDNLLLLKVWATQDKRLRDKSHSFVGFSRDFLSGSYASIESVTRSRRKIQEGTPELRGKNYLNRQKACAETTVEINN